MLDTFGMQSQDFVLPEDLALDKVVQEVPSGIEPEHLSFLVSMCGQENVSTDTYARIDRSYGCGMIDSIRLRRHIIENLPDVVVAPRSQAEIEQIIGYCNEHRLPVYIFGGGSSVIRGFEAVKSGISLDMSKHMNRVVAFNELNQTITVEAGMSGPQLEDLLNHAPEKLGAKRRYTCGHFPQSFEYSSVGGWVVTRGAGQNSTYFGKIEDIVMSQEYVTPKGVFKTQDQPRAATGPDFDQLMMGSEGCFGVLTNITLKLFRFQLQNKQRFCFMFKNWDDAWNAYREIMQSEFGYPSVFRLSDPEETEVAMHQYALAGTPADTALKLAGHKPMQKCLLLGYSEGECGFARHIKGKIRSLCLRRGAFNLGPMPVRMWEKGRYKDPYMREDLQDFGVMIDTLECAVTWSNMEKVHQAVREVVHSRPKTICMTHISHAYPQGSNLYFIFIARMNSIKEYLEMQYAILDAIQKSGAAMSHHHGIGKQTAPWLEEQIGTPAMDVVRALKLHFDPFNIMNPGGTLGLDLSEEQKIKSWSMNLED